MLNYRSMFHLSPLYHLILPSFLHLSSNHLNYMQYHHYHLLVLQHVLFLDLILKNNKKQKYCYTLIFFLFYIKITYVYTATGLSTILIFFLFFLSFLKFYFYRLYPINIFFINIKIKFSPNKI